MLIIDFLEILVFPGLIFVVAYSLFLMWLVRKLAARIENRVGPPLFQPAFDVAKLMAKERVYPEGANKTIIHYFPRVKLILVLLMALFIPIYSNKGILSFDGDLYFFIFLLALSSSTLFFMGWASRNPYSLSGAGRGVFVEISLEIPLALSLSGLSIMTGSMRISDIYDTVWDTIFSNQVMKSYYSLLYLIPWILMLSTVIYCAIGVLELNPFSAPHAETEIVSGWNTELTGSDLALVELSHIITLFNVTGLIASVFLGRYLTGLEDNLPLSIFYLLQVIVFLIKTIIIVFVIALIITLSSRLRIDQVTKALWNYFLPISMISVLLVLFIQQLGGT